MLFIATVTLAVPILSKFEVQTQILSTKRFDYSNKHDRISDLNDTFFWYTRITNISYPPVIREGFYSYKDWNYFKFNLTYQIINPNNFTIEIYCACASLLYEYGDASLLDENVQIHFSGHVCLTSDFTAYLENNSCKERTREISFRINSTEITELPRGHYEFWMGSHSCYPQNEYKISFIPFKSYLDVTRNYITLSNEWNSNTTLYERTDQSSNEMNTRFIILLGIVIVPIYRKLKNNIPKNH